MKNEEEIYNSALQTAGRAIKKFNIVGILPGDLVNDSWIDVYNSGMEIDFNTLNKFITNKAYQINYNKDNEITIEGNEISYCNSVVIHTELFNLNINN